MEKEIYKGSILRLTEERIESTVWERVYLPSGVIIFPITNEGKIILIKERRPHESPQMRIKPISGILESEKGTPLENAQREMQEEIGLRAERMELLWTLTSTGTVNNTQYFFTAHGLSSSKIPNPDGEDIVLEIIEYDPQELLSAILEDKIKWSMSTLGIFRLFKSLRLSI